MTDARPVPLVSLTSGSALAPPMASAAPPVPDSLTQDPPGVIGEPSGTGVGTSQDPGETASPIELPVADPVVTNQPPVPGPAQHLRRRLVVSDCLALCLSWIVLGMAFGDSALSLVLRGSLGVPPVIATLAAMQLLGLYRSRICMRRTQEFQRIVLAALAGAAIFDVVQRHYGVNGPLVVCALGAIVVLSIFRWNYRRWLSNCRSKGMYLRKVVLIGGNYDATDQWRPPLIVLRDVLLPALQSR